MPEPKLAACAFAYGARVGLQARELLRAIDVVEANDARDLLVPLARERCAQKVVDTQQRCAVGMAEPEARR